MSSEDTRAEGDKVQVKLMLDPAAAEVLLRLAGSPRKQGEYVSRLILAAAASESSLATLESLDLAGLRELVGGLLIDMADLKAQWSQVQEELRSSRRRKTHEAS